MLNLQEKLTCLECKPMGKYNNIIVYADFCDKMDRELEDFRAKTIYKQEPEYKERTSILGKLEFQKTK